MTQSIYKLSWTLLCYFFKFRCFIISYSSSSFFVLYSFYNTTILVFIQLPQHSILSLMLNFMVVKFSSSGKISIMFSAIFWFKNLKHHNIKIILNCFGLAPTIRYKKNSTCTFWNISEHLGCAPQISRIRRICLTFLL